VTSTSPQQDYIEAVRQGQQAVVSAVQAWSDSLQRLMSGGAASAAQAPRPAEVIDQVFDFAQQMLNAQRDFTKKLLEATGSTQPPTTTA